MCNCASCEYTDSFADKGFAEWPKGEPKGKRKSAAEYLSHVAFGKATSERAIPPALLKFKPGQPAVITGGFTPPAPLPAKYRQYIAAGYRITTPQTDDEETPKDKGSVSRPRVRTAPGSSPARHFRRGTRPRQHRRVYDMPPKPRGIADNTRRALIAVSEGMTAYAAAKAHGIALSTIYRAQKRQRANPRQVPGPVAPASPDASRPGSEAPKGRPI